MENLAEAPSPFQKCVIILSHSVGQPPRECHVKIKKDFWFLDQLNIFPSYPKRKSKQHIRSAVRDGEGGRVHASKRKQRTDEGSVPFSTTPREGCSSCAVIWSWGEGVQGKFPVQFCRSVPHEFGDWNRPKLVDARTHLCRCFCIILGAATVLWCGHGEI